MNILIADDHAIVRKGLAQLLADEFPGVSIGETAGTQETLAELSLRRWDVLVLDIFMPGSGGLTVLDEARRSHPEMPVLVLSTAPEEQMAARVLKAGASGYLNKQCVPEELVSAVRKVLAHGRYVSATMAERLAADIGRPERSLQEELSDREYTVLRMLVAGRSIKDIAAAQSPYAVKRLPAGLIYKVLIVDDNDSSRDILQILLAEKGFITHEATTGREALSAFWKWRPELIFMDLQMPDMDGMEAIRQIRATPEGEKTPIIVITASALEETQGEVLAAGANGFIRKPFREEELSENIMKALPLVCGKEETEKTAVPEPAGDAKVAGERPSVPSAVRDELREATLKGDLDALHAIAERLTEENRPLSEFIRKSADAFDYDAITNLLEESHDRG